MSSPGSDGSYHPEPEEVEAGPSELARWRPLPRSTYRSIEYPGPVRNPEAIMKVVSQADVDECFNGPIQEPRQLEMKYRPEERSSVPVRGTRVQSQKVLVRVTKRRRKGQDGGVFTSEIVGSVPQTVRFRSMADYQYTPAADGHIQQLTQSLLDLDYDAILDYQFPEIDEHYYVPAEEGDIPFVSRTELQPTPVSSMRHLPHVFSYKMPTAAVQEKVWDEELGDYKVRYVNKTRASGFSVPVIGHGHPVPKEPEEAVKARLPHLDARLLKKLQDLMEQRPVWLRYALLAHFNDSDRYEIESNKAYIPSVAFTYGAGPYWKTMVRYGYDPCKDREAHIYQRVFVYLDVKRGKNNVLNDLDDDDDEKSRGGAFWWENEAEKRVQAGLRPPLDSTKSYIFDGELLHQNKPDFLMCDIHDPFIARFIHDPTSLADDCNPVTGWYRPISFETIKALLRIRYQYLRDKHRKIDDRGVCAEVEDVYERAMNGEEEEDAATAAIHKLAMKRKG